MLGTSSSALSCARLNRVQIRISTGGALAPKLARNADTQGRLSSKLTYIGVAQHLATMRRVFVAAVSFTALRRSGASRAGDAVPAERHKFRATVGASQGRRIGGCGEPLGGGLTIVAIASRDDEWLAPGADFDRATSAMRDVSWICHGHEARAPQRLS